MFKKGDKVRIVECIWFPDLVGKIGTIQSVSKYHKDVYNLAKVKGLSRFNYYFRFNEIEKV